MTAPDPTPDEVALVLSLGDSDPLALDNMRTEWARRIVASDLIASSWLAERDARIRGNALREARAIVERQTDHVDRPSDFRKGVLTCLAALDAASKEARRDRS